MDRSFYTEIWLGSFLYKLVHDLHNLNQWQFHSCWGQGWSCSDSCWTPTSVSCVGKVPLLYIVLAHAIYSISRSFASCPHCLGRDGSERILCRPCSKAGEQTNDGFCSYFFANILFFQVRKSLMSGLAWTSYEAAVFSKKSPLWRLFESPDVNVKVTI